MLLVKILDGKFIVGFSNCGNSNGFDVTYIAKRVINGKYVVLLNETMLGGSGVGGGGSGGVGGGFDGGDLNGNDITGLSGGEVGIEDGVNNGSGVGGFTGFDTGGVIIGGGGVDNFIDGVNSNINNTLGDADSYDDTNTNNVPCEGKQIYTLGLVMYCVSSGEYYKTEVNEDRNNLNYIPISKSEARAILLNALCSDYNAGVTTLDVINSFLKDINLDPVNDDDECNYI